MKHLALLSLLLFSFKCFATCTLPPASGLKTQFAASCQLTIKWKKVNGAVSYNIQYKQSAASTWTVVNNIGNTAIYTITATAAGTSYDVKVAAVCASGEEGSYSTTFTTATPSCTKPANVTASSITSTSAILSWATTCGESNFKLSYRKTGAASWINISGLAATNYTLTGLLPSTSYQVKVKSICSGQGSAFSPIVNFTTQSSVAVTGKNVLLVIVDDARFDSYTANDGPSFFADSNISRVADEGVNFQLSFPAQSLCAPSRASIATGLYPHIHGVTENPRGGEDDTITQITLPQILQNHNYYTGLIGKYHISNNPQPGYNYWMEMHGNNYFDATWNINGTKLAVPGHNTDVITDSAIGFLHKVPAGKPFFLWFAYKAPHTPMDPRPEDAGLFDDDSMPIPDDFYEYTENAPEFLYDCHYAHDTSFVSDYYRGYFELLQGVEVTLGKVFNELKTMGIMDSTLIIFMSDNGYLLGEHFLLEKELAYEPSMRIPIFMRYPSLIPAGKKINKQIAMNIDIAPTILDFAGIDDTFGMQGISLLKLLDQQVTRKEMLYEFFNHQCVPDIRAVRSINYKYVQYNCSDVTEEFFDLNNDPEENVNLINNPADEGLIQQYRDKLTFWRNYYKDFTWDSLYSCSLSNPQKLPTDGKSPLVLLNIYPNPSSSSIYVHFISSEDAASSVRIVNAIGAAVYAENGSETGTEYSNSFSVQELPPGNYFLILQHGVHSYRQGFVVE
jgi:N-acetylglucosamine-6-sulfatase